MVDQVKVGPAMLSFAVPSCGKTEEEQFIKITNNNPEKRITFKMKVTHQDRFRVEPAFGYIEARKSVGVKCKPRVFNNLTNKSNHEHFTVLFDIAPRNAPPVARNLWKHGSIYEPLNPTRQTVKIQYYRKQNKCNKSENEENEDDEDSEDEDSDDEDSEDEDSEDEDSEDEDSDDQQEEIE